MLRSTGPPRWRVSSVGERGAITSFHFFRISARVDLSSCTLSRYGRTGFRCVAIRSKHGSATTAIKLALICKRFREAIEDGEGGAFATRRRLVTIQETSLQKDLITALALSPIHVKLGPHTRKRNRYGGFYHIFTHATAVTLFLSHGGFERLEIRLQRKGRSGNK